DGPGGQIDLWLPDLTVARDNCGHYTIETTHVVRADLLLLQDKSRSMTQGVRGERNPGPGQSKWELVRSAIEQVVERTSSVDWGLMLFGQNGGCGAPVIPDVPVGPGNSDRVRAALENSSPDSSTPTTATLRNALTWFGQLEDHQPHYLLLATDG